MPEFQMNGKHTKEFSDLDSFTQGYLEALFFTETGGSIARGTFDPENGSALPDEASFSDLHPESLQTAIADCARFQSENATDLETAYAMREGMTGEYDAERAGNDFWFTRNGHGVGYWDRGLAEIGDRLSAAAKTYGERWANWDNDTETVHID